jgi:hypothetical protein
MGSSLETRRNDKDVLFMLFQIRDSVISIDDAIAEFEARMEPEDVKLVKQTYEELKKKKHT